MNIQKAKDASTLLSKIEYYEAHLKKLEGNYPITDIRFGSKNGIETLTIIPRGLKKYIISSLTEELDYLKATLEDL